MLQRFGLADQKNERKRNLLAKQTLVYQRVINSTHRPFFEILGWLI